MGVLPVYRKSFFCSPLRPDGLGLTMIYDNGMVCCDVRVDNRFEGYDDVIHGGMVMGILDTMMWYAIIMETKKVAMTRTIEMDFYKPVLCNVDYSARAQFLKAEDRDIYASAWFEDSSGEVCSRVTGLFREAKDVSMRHVVDRLDFSEADPEIVKHFLSLLEG
jgi:acyl-coenzyme A thioesterase PaaI-like protein